MKKEMKTELTRKRIIEASLYEFGQNGYAFSTVDSICEHHQLSKGIIYHNYQSKDQLYLLCVYRVFSELVAYIQNHIDDSSNKAEDRLQSYLDTRRRFFRENPLFLKIFCDALFSAPSHLETQISEIRQHFANKNIEIVKEIMHHLPFRKDVPQDKIINIFCQSFDLMTVISHYKTNHFDIEETETYTLKFLLQGVIER